MTNISSNGMIIAESLELISNIFRDHKRNCITINLTKVWKTSDYFEAKHTSYLLNDILGKLLGMHSCNYQVLKSIKGG